VRSRGVARLAPALLVAAAVVAAADEVGEAPPVDEAIAAARAASRPLVLEFSTSWCRPCRILEERLLPDPEVRAALGAISFVRYDAERGAGIAAAARFGVTAYPTLIAVRSDGTAGERLVGPGSAAALAAWLRQTVASLQPALPDMVAAARSRPTTGLLLALGRRYLADGDRASAKRWLAAAERLAGGGTAKVAPPSSRAKAEARRERGRGKPETSGAPSTASPSSAAEAEAAGWELARIEIEDGERALRARLAAAYLERHPDGAHAVEAAQVYSLAVRATDDGARADAERILGRAIDASRESGSRMTSLILSCLRAGATDAALRGATRGVERDRSALALSVLAEVRHERGDNAGALALLDEAEPLATPPLRPLLAAYRARYRKGGSDPGDALATGDPLAPAAARATPPPPSPEQEAAERRAVEYRRLLERVARACGPIAASSAFRRLWVRVALEAGVVRQVVVLEPSAPVLLQACVVAELRGAPFAHPVPGEDTFAIPF
jgi:thiol-disulfide isomerase/thioredoxin